MHLGMQTATAALVLLFIQMPVVLGEDIVVYSGNFSCSSWLGYWSTSLGPIAGKVTVQVRSLDNPPIRASYAALANYQQASLHFYNSYYCGASQAQLSLDGPTLVSKTVDVGYGTPGTDCQCSSPFCTTYAYVKCGAASRCNPASLYCSDKSGTGKFEVIITEKTSAATTTGAPTTQTPALTTTPPPAQVLAESQPTPTPRPVPAFQRLPQMTHVVKMAVSLPMTVEQFNADAQTKFKESIAKAAGAMPEDVTIDQIEAIPVGRRRLLASIIRVDTSVKAVDTAAAEAMRGKLTSDNINAELKMVCALNCLWLGFPQCVCMRVSLRLRVSQSPRRLAF
eukprot:Tamp_10887.p1 GENE.Tamp_10887~~Tamp_10887.p1  ORF type:complete len:338 (+),score=46.88 Tamp_10887:402-1415(+)